MKLRIMSDLHIEAYEAYRPSVDIDEKNAILILAGDICEIRRRAVLIAFFAEMSERFGHVIYVPGNHEYYNGNIEYSGAKLHDMLKFMTNVHILCDNSVNIDGINFIGSTLWTSVNNGNPLDVWDIERGMNDYYVIRTKTYARLRASDTIKLHDKSVKFICSELTRMAGQLNIVVTHHIPCTLSIADRFKTSTLNAAYVTDLTNIIEMHSPSVWVHGHTHDSFNYKIFNTNVICNPRGYPTQRRGIAKADCENVAFREILNIYVDPTNHTIEIPA